MKEYSKEELEAILKRHEKSQMTTKRVWVRNLLLVQKARAKGITVTEAEVDDYIKNKKK